MIVATGFDFQPLPDGNVLIEFFGDDGKAFNAFSLLSPRACRVTHGPCDCYFEYLADKTVGSVRRSLASIFSIPDEADAWVGGSIVGPEYRLRAGDSVEFLVRRGRKAVGELLTPEQLIQRWNITEGQYQQLLKAGLPTIRFEDEAARHPEVAVDEWLRCRFASCPDAAGTAIDLKRIADHFDPPPPDIVGSAYVASRLGCTTTWVADMVRRGEIPPHAVVPGTGNGKPWKFFRSRIDSWITSR
jgi:hypothetical protein